MPVTFFTMGKYYMSRWSGRIKAVEALQKLTTNPQAVLERFHDISFTIDQAIKLNCNENKLFLQRLPSHAKKDVPRISRVLMLLFSDHFLKDDRNALRNLTISYTDSLCGQVVCKIRWFIK